MSESRLPGTNQCSSGTLFRSDLRQWTIAFVCMALLLFSSQADAQDAAQQPVLAGIAHVAIRVSNLAAARSFYERLGYQEAFAMNKGGTPTEAFLKINNQQFIELYPQRQPGQQIGFLHVCFESKDIASLNGQYASRGLDPTPVKRAGAGNLLFTMKGPEQQNIEYTQYMPGSRHTLDIGHHLGPDRISDQIAAVGIEMQELAVAADFYRSKLSFAPLKREADPGFPAFALPGASGQQIELIPPTPGSSFRLILAVDSLRRTAVRLQALHIAIERKKASLVVRDPDGNRIVFVKAQPHGIRG